MPCVVNTVVRIVLDGVGHFNLIVILKLKFSVIKQKLIGGE